MAPALDLARTGEQSRLCQKRTAGWCEDTRFRTDAQSRPMPNGESVLDLQNESEWICTIEQRYEAPLRRIFE
jgi:hypothetical protein